MRLLVHVEGQTEETFVNEILKPHLYSFGYTYVSARLMGNARLKQNRGGIRSWATAKSEIIGHLKNDPKCISTTMVDFYGLPQDGDRAWPGRANTAHLPCLQRALSVENALYQEVALEFGFTSGFHRFVPFVMLHEFEALLFSDPPVFAKAIGQPTLSVPFQQIRNTFNTPEDINDSPLTAPSKRVLAHMPSYEKPLFGVLAVLEIGLSNIRSECPHFAEWLSNLEALPMTLMPTQESY